MPWFLGDKHECVHMCPSYRTSDTYVKIDVIITTFIQKERRMTTQYFFPVL